MNIADRYINFNSSVSDWRKNMQTTLPQEDRTELLKLSDAACLLYLQYLSMRKMNNQDFSDEVLQKYFPEWSKRKLGNTRRALIKAGWFYQVKGRYTDGRGILTTYIGKDVVFKATHELGKAA